MAEVNALAERLPRGRAPRRARCAIGSVKSMIGHTKCAAGLAGLINASLALHHKVLPADDRRRDARTPRPTSPTARSASSTEARPWLHADADRPRRAGVSAFGFGGTNFHAVLEAYDRDPTPRPPPPCATGPPSCSSWREPDREALLARARPTGRTRSTPAPGPPLARPGARAVERLRDRRGARRPTLAIVADVARRPRGEARSGPGGDRRRRAPTLDDPRGVYFAERPAFAGRPVAFLFPGQGSQSLEMLGDLAVAFPEVREAFDDVRRRADRATGRPPVGPRVFPPPAFDDAAASAPQAALTATDVAQPAVGAACRRAAPAARRASASSPTWSPATATASWSPCTRPGPLDADGPGRALRGAGPVPARGRWATSRARWPRSRPGPTEVGRLIGRARGVVGGQPERPEADGRRRARRPGSPWPSSGPAGTGIRRQDLPVAVRVPLARWSPARASRWRDWSPRLVAAAPDLPVYSNLDAAPHPADPAAIAGRLGEHLAAPGPVRGDGRGDARRRGPGLRRGRARLGPRAAGRLDPRRPAAPGRRAATAPGRPGIAGPPARPGPAGRRGRPARARPPDRRPIGAALDLRDLPARRRLAAASPSTWLVNGSRARPIGQPEPRRLGQGPALPVAGPPDADGRRAARPGTATAPATDASATASSTNGKPTHRPRRRTRDPAPRPASLGRRPGPRGVPGDDAGLPRRPALDHARLPGRPAGRARRRDGPRPDRPPRADRRTAPTAADRRAGRRSPTPPRPRADAGRGPAPSRRPSPSPASAATRSPRLLVEIVRDRTGYPAEMLGLDLDLEADLGIDSIKRVEILGTPPRRRPGAGRVRPTPTTMDALSRARTLGAIVDRVVELADRPESPDRPRRDGRAPIEPAPRPPVRSGGWSSRSVAAPLGERPAGLAPGGVVVVTDDGRGIAREVAADLAAAGHPVAVGMASGRRRRGGRTSRPRRRSRRCSSGPGRAGRSRGSSTPCRSATPPDAGLDAGGLGGAGWGPRCRGCSCWPRAAADDLERASARAAGPA